MLLAGCSIFGRSSARPRSRPSPTRPDPVAPLLAGEQALLRTYDAVLARHPQLLPRLAPVRADHAAHLQSLQVVSGGTATGGSGAGARGPSPEPAPTVPTQPAAALATLRAAERSAAGRAGAACLGAPRSRVALLGSIAACESAHLVLLQ